MTAFLRRLLALALLVAWAAPAPAEARVQHSVRYLHRAQGEVFRSPARFRYSVCGRGWGKTHLGVAEILRAVTQDPRARRHGGGYLCAYVGPTFDQSRDLIWEWLLEELPASFIKKTNHTRLEVLLKWGPKIKLYGADKLRRTRGLSVNFLVVDEFAHMRDGIWSTLRPTLRRPEDRALLITTPAGPNHAFELWNRVQGMAGWKTWQQPTWANPHHDPAILHEGKGVMAPADFDQEFGAVFMALRGAIYGDFAADPARNVPAQPLGLDPNREVFVGQDYNGGLYSAVVAQDRPEHRGLDVVGEVVTRSNIYAHTDNLRSWLQERGVRNIGQQVTVCADVSGDYNHTSKTDSSDNAIMRGAGFAIAGNPRNPPVNERVLAVQGLILNKAGDVRLRVTPECRELIHCLLNQIWNRWGKPDKTKGLDHLPDALGYLVDYLYPIDRTGGAVSRAA